MKDLSSRIQTGLMTASLFWGAYYLTVWRTTEFGFSVRQTISLILVAIISVLPVTVLAVLGLSWRKAILRLTLTLLVMVGCAEAFAGIQEFLVVQRYGENPSQQIFIARWPPFENHHIAYSPGYGWIGGD